MKELHDVRTGFPGPRISDPSSRTTGSGSVQLRIRIYIHLPTTSKVPEKEGRYRLKLRICLEFCLLFHHEFCNRSTWRWKGYPDCLKLLQNMDPGDQKVTDPEHRMNCCYKSLYYLNIVVIVLFFGFLDWLQTFASHRDLKWTTLTIKKS
jgi:hypothetical protein